MLLEVTKRPVLYWMTKNDYLCIYIDLNQKKKGGREETLVSTDLVSH
jgi:hypothetical protein